MSRSRCLYRDGVKVYAEENGEVLFDNRSDVCYGQGPMVMTDISPYKSVIDGSTITSRSRHREHLKAHGCVEVGNEKVAPKPRSIAPGIRQDVIDAYKRSTGKL